jgi:hypothetical protein
MKIEKKTEFIVRRYEIMLFNNRSDQLKKSLYFFFIFNKTLIPTVRRNTQCLITLTATSEHINTPSVELVVSYINYIALMSTFIIKNIYRYISKKIHSTFYTCTLFQIQVKLVGNDNFLLILVFRHIHF